MSNGHDVTPDRWKHNEWFFMACEKIDTILYSVTHTINGAKGR